MVYQPRNEGRPMTDPSFSAPDRRVSGTARRPRRAHGLPALCAALLLAIPFLRAQPAAAATVPVSLTITRFVQLTDPDPNADQYCGDYYAAVTIDGEALPYTEVVDGNTDTCINWPAGTPYT